VLVDGAREAIGFTAGFEYPAACVRAATAASRTPIGDAFDALYCAPAGRRSGHVGNIGRLSGGAPRARTTGAGGRLRVRRLLHRSLRDDAVLGSSRLSLTRDDPLFERRSEL
jgi:hypothetical protein